jgi:putative modified peptide
MAQGKGKGPNPMDPKVAKRLLDKLASDDDFRDHFTRDAQSALESIGYVAPTEAGVASAGACLQLKPGTSLASPADIESSRSKLEESLVAIHGFAAPKGFVA